MEVFERARSVEAKQERERAILAAARALAVERGVREITLTDIAAAIGMHKSALLRYFETREQIYLRLTAAEWRDWGPAVRERLADARTPAEIAAAFASTLVARPLFCDLLAHTPLNLERNVSLESVREFKLVTHDEVDRIIAELRRILPALSLEAALDVVATATSLAGAQWQMANPGEEVAALYRSDPRLGHAIVDVEPRLVRVLTAQLRGSL
ncbi:MAG: TetR/AcrR family transcriptional regulator [Microbacteriaceae bacterium]|nr:TetR/AcrR family transcriptional regulator [Microbacteriaceae bacterium]